MANADQVFSEIVIPGATYVSGFGSGLNEFSKGVTQFIQNLSGDTIKVRTAVLSARESKSRPDAGIIEFEHSATNQRGEIVAECKRQALMRKRPKA